MKTRKIFTVLLALLLLLPPLTSCSAPTSDWEWRAHERRESNCALIVCGKDITTEANAYLSIVENDPPIPDYPYPQSDAVLPFLTVCRALGATVEKERFGRINITLNGKRFTLDTATVALYYQPFPFYRVNLFLPAPGSTGSYAAKANGEFYLSDNMLDLFFRESGYSLHIDSEKMIVTIQNSSEK